MSVIIWGRKRVEKHIGFVADYCPMCVGVRPFALERIGMAGHVYYITTGEGDLVGYQIGCLECHILLNGQHERYAAFSPKVEPLPELTRLTFPNLAEYHRSRLALEHQVRTALPSLPEDTRRSLILEPFLLLSAKVTSYFETTHFERGNTFIKRDILPVLARTLARLQPAEQEIKGALTRLTQLRHVIGKRVQVDELMHELELLRVHTPPPGATKIGKIDWNNPGMAAHHRARSGLVLLPHQKAARVMLIWGCVAVLYNLGLLMSMVDDQIGKNSYAVSMLLFGFVVALTGIVSAKAVREHKDWGRIAGLLFGAGSLINLPFGTVLGGYVIWQLFRHWHNDA
ncbi:MAG: hypothetical protein ACJ8GW_02595 [Massilia sp.]